MAIISDGNRLMVTGDFGRDDLPRLLAALYNIVDLKGYRDVVLDFSFCIARVRRPNAGSMLQVPNILETRYRR